MLAVKVSDNIAFCRGPYVWNSMRSRRGGGHGRERGHPGGGCGWDHFRSGGPRLWCLNRAALDLFQQLKRCLVRVGRADVGHIGQGCQQPGANIGGSVDGGDLFALNKGPDFEQGPQQLQALDALRRWEVIIEGVLDQLLHQ